MQKVVTGCPGNCGGSCPILAYVEEGRIVRVSPEDYGGADGRPQLRPCAIGLSHVQRVHHPDRLLYPLRRVGERGEGAFQRITWEEALNKMASEMLRVKRRYGPEAILGLAGSGNVKGLMSAGVLARRFLNAFGGHTTTRASISNQGAVFASDHTLGQRLPPPSRESLLRSKLVIMWGLNPSETIQGTNMNWYLAQAKESGTRFIFVDPRFSNSAAALADQWIPICPGTDAAMLVAMAFVLIREKLCDGEFLTRCIYGFEHYRDYCLGVVDGEPKTPAWAEDICGVPAETIAVLARDYAGSKPANLWPGYAPGRTAFGGQFHRACIALAAMTGNIGIPGGGVACYFGRDLQATLGVSELDRLPNLTEKSVVGWRWADAVLRGKEGGYPSDIKMIVSVAGERLNQCGDINKGIQALKKVDFVVVLDQFLTPIARYADLVLPVATQFEREDVQLSKGWYAYMFHSGKAIEPVGECWSDLEIFTQLARRLGLEHFPSPGEEQWLDELMAEAAVDLEKLGKQGIYWYQDSQDDDVPLREFVQDPEGHPLPTASGKIEIYSQSIAKMGLPDLLPPIPTYIDTWEGPHHPLSRQYPLLLVTWHSGRRIHSTFDNVPWLRELEPHTLWMNPRDAQKRDIRDGDMVEVFNDIGSTVIQAKITERIMPGVVGIYQGVWFNLDRSGKDRAGSVNMLCKDTVSPGEAAATNGILVQAVRWEA
jgi:anaerobic dimethyl sulfoxide reductase subunit A